MAEYFGDTQLVSLDNPIVFDAIIPCKRGCVYHENGTGVFTLKGMTTNCFARYQVTLNANVLIPTGGAVTAVALAIAVNGEPRTTSKAIFQPQAVEEYGNLTSTCIITVPKNCCFTLSVRYVDATTDDATVTPTPTVQVANANLVVSRIA